MKWQKRIFFMCKVIIMARNDLTVGSKKAVLLKVTRAHAYYRNVSLFPNHPITRLPSR